MCLACKPGMAKPSLMFRVRSVTRDGFKIHGICFPFVLLHRTWVYFFRKCIVPPRKFMFAGKNHAYVIHPFILDNERTVEVAIANEFLRGKAGEILEVGNVWANFSRFPHDVVGYFPKNGGS